VILFIPNVTETNNKLDKTIQYLTKA